MTVIKPKPFMAEGPQPLVREIPPGDAYPVHALGPLREAVEAVHAATQAPVAIAAQSALSVASLVVQGHADVEGIFGSFPTSLYCLTVAQSGERKSGCDKLIMRGIKEVEERQWPDYREAESNHDTDLRLWTARRDRMVKDACGKQPQRAREAEADLQSLGPAPAPPPSPMRTISEPTIEGMVKLFQTGQPALGLFTDEGGSFLGGHAMNSDNRLKTVAGFSKMWDGNPIDRVRAGDGASKLYGRRLACHIMVQPVAARPFLADPVANGQGFLARFLITEPLSTIGTRLGDTGRLAQCAAIGAVAHRINAILATPFPTKEGRPQELDPRVLRLSPEARTLLFSYCQATERAQAAGGELDGVTAFASKSPEQAARITGVLALWDDIHAATVSAEQMANGIELAQFYLGEAKRLAESATISAETDRAEKLRQWIVDCWPSLALSRDRDPETILPSDVVQFGPSQFREASAARKLMTIIATYGWLQPLEVGDMVAGKSRKLAYQIVRAQ